MTFTADQLALKAHIEAKNAETQAWVDAAPGRWAIMPVSDPAHWAEYGIFTIEQYEHDAAASTVYDMTKETFGYKPSWDALMAMTIDELHAEIDRIARVIKMDAQRETDEHERAIKACMDAGAPDRATAERWLNQA